jgi:hypothetical protein
VRNVTLLTLRRQASSGNCPENSAPPLPRSLCIFPRPVLRHERLALQNGGRALLARSGTFCAKGFVHTLVIAGQERKDS